MAIDNRSESERRYDATALSRPRDAEPPAQAGRYGKLIKVLEAIEPYLDLDTEDDTPEVLSLAEARTLALQHWCGETRTTETGTFRRYPELPRVAIARLDDGTPVMGAFDSDDRPLFVFVAWRGISILSDEDDTLNVNDGRTSNDLITLAQLHDMADMVTAGVPEQVLAIARVWCMRPDEVRPC